MVYCGLGLVDELVLAVGVLVLGWFGCVALFVWAEVGLLYRVGFGEVWGRGWLVARRITIDGSVHLQLPSLDEIVPLLLSERASISGLDCRPRQLSALDQTVAHVHPPEVEGLGQNTQEVVSRQLVGWFAALEELLNKHDFDVFCLV